MRNHGAAVARMSRPRRSARHPGAQFVTHPHRNRVVSPRVAPTLKRRSPPCRNWQSRLDWHWRRPRPMRKVPSPDNRRRPPLPARVAYGRSYLMDECEVMASGRERSPTIITSVLAPSSCLRKQASLDASDESAPRLLSFHLFMGSVSASGRDRSSRSETKSPLRWAGLHHTVSSVSEKLWSGRRGSNPRPRPWQGRALPLSYTRIRDGGDCSPATADLCQMLWANATQERGQGATKSLGFLKN